MSLNILKHLDKNNLHHAYLIEGARGEIVPAVVNFLENINIKTAGNPDFYNISMDSFKIDDSFNLRAMSTDKGFTLGKKIYIISANSLTLDAQNVLLKMFEEPAVNTHFFVIVPDANSLLKTLVSRFYLISDAYGNAENAKEAEKFMTLSLKDRIDFIKELLADPEEEDEAGNEIVVLDSARSKALKFLNALETSLYSKVSKAAFDTETFEHFFKVREFLRMPGSSAKNLLESVAIVVPRL
jgi:hypothetical protein